MSVPVGLLAYLVRLVLKVLLELPATLDQLGLLVRGAHLDQVDHKEALGHKDLPATLAVLDRRASAETLVNKDWLDPQDLKASLVCLALLGKVDSLVNRDRLVSVAAQVWQDK
jgi:hypothetical protein